jgi:hypothetical protein
VAGQPTGAVADHAAPVTAVPPTPPPPTVAAPAAPPAPDGRQPSPTASRYSTLAEDRAPEREFGGPQEFEVPARRWPLVLALSLVGIVALSGVSFAVYWFAIRPALTPPGSSRATSTETSGSANASAAAGETGGAGQTPTGSVSATSSGVATPTGSASKARGSGMPERAPLVAYRADGGLWVADDGGGDRRRIVDSTDGEFALSPDGSRLAVADSTTGRLLVADVATGRTTDAGPADDAPPAWAPDGSFVVWTATRASAPRVMRASRDGASALVLSSGGSPQVTLDGKNVLFIARTGQAEGGRLGRTDARIPDRARVMLTQEPVFAFAETPDSLVLVTGSGKRSLVRARPDGSGATQLLGPPSEAGAYTYARLFVSPDARSLAFARAGDDGFSRMSVMPLAGGSAVDLSPRHDDYPLGWTPDATRVLFISGNAVAGQKTELAGIRPDGTNRIVLVTGAGL